MSYKIIETKKLILSKVEFIKSKQGGYINKEIEVCKLDFSFETLDQQKTIIKNVLSWLDCEHENKVITKIINDIGKREYSVFKQEKKGLKTELLKTYSLKVETTTYKQFSLL